MDDGVSIATTLYTPDGAVPVGGRPGVVVLHGLAGNRGSVDAISASFATAGYAVLAYDARGHGASGGEITLAGPREVAELRTIRNAFAARGDVNDSKVGAWGISYGGGQLWNALAAGVPFAAAEVVETWTSLYDALWPHDLARSGIVAGFAASIAARSPLVAGLRDAAVQSTNQTAIRRLTEDRSSLSRPDRSGRRCTSSRAAPTSLSTSRRRRAPSRVSPARSGSTWATSVTPRPPSPGPISGSCCRRDVPSSTRISRASTAAVHPGRTTLSGSASAERHTAPRQTAIESWGGGTATVTLSKLTRYPRLVVTVTAGSKIVGHGGRQTAQRQIVFLQVRTVVSGRTVTCTPTFGVPRLRATRAGVNVRSNAVRVVIPARKR